MYVYMVHFYAFIPTSFYFFVPATLVQYKSMKYLFYSKMYSPHPQRLNEICKETKSEPLTCILHSFKKIFLNVLHHVNLCCFICDVGM